MEYKVTVIKTGVVTSFSKNQKHLAIQYMNELIKEEIEFCYSIER